MRIDKLTASFGRLQNESLTLGEGLNVIYAPNESGKSTWCAFIRAMLYGVDSSERARAGYLPDKTRYAPWSGAPMEGSMELTSEGRHITLTRTTPSPGAPMREFSATYTGTSTRVEGMSGLNAGESLTGVSREVFRRSAFVGQGSVAVTDSPELEKRIMAIVASGEEQTSYSEADRRLRTWQRKRRYNRRGILPELEGRIFDTRQTLEAMNGSLAEIEELEQELRMCEQECAVLERTVAEKKKQQRRDSLSRVTAKRSELNRCMAEQSAAMENLSCRRRELAESFFAGSTPEEAEAAVAADIAALRELSDNSGKCPSPVLALIFFIVAAVIWVLYALRGGLVFMGCAIAAVIAGGAFFVLNISDRRSYAAAQARQEEIIDRYGASSPNEIKALLLEHRALFYAAQDAAEEELICRENCTLVSRELAELEESTLRALDFSGGDTDAANLNRELKTASARRDELSRKLSVLSGRISAAQDPLVLSSELNLMEDEYAKVSREFEAITLAAETLRQADTELQSRFSPALGRVAADYMSRVTGGRYADILIGRDFSAQTRTSGDAVARDSTYLSTGTLDLMYLAVRLAVCELALPAGEPCPLIIDDALVNLDEERFAEAMKLLEGIAEKRQVILFTCRNK